MNAPKQLTRLLIPDTSTTPVVDFDPKMGIFRMAGVSIPENATAFYLPLLEWVRSYCAAPAEKTLVQLDFNYFNTVTSKVLLEFLLAFEELSRNGHNIEVQWLYDRADSDMLSAGEDYSLLLNLPFKMIPREGVS